MALRTPLLLVSVAVVIGAVFAANASQPMTPAEALSYVRAGDLHVSPDGKRLAYVAISYRWDWQPHVRVLDVATREERELTPPGKSERSPQWSADGKLAFLSNRGGETQIYAAAAGASQPAALTARKNGVQSFHWSPNGKSIAYLATTDDAPSSDDGPQVADRESDLAHLWLLNVATKSDRELPTKGTRIDEFQWQDDRHILLIATDKPAIEEDTDAVYRTSTQTGAMELLAKPPQPFDSLIVSPDARRFVLRSTSVKGPFARNLFIGTGGNDLHRMAGLLDLTVAETKWREPSVLWARLNDGFVNRIWRIPARGTPQEIPLPLSVAAFDVAPDGRLAFIGEDFRHLPELYLRDANGGIRQISHLQDGANGIRLAPATIFRTKSFDGTPIESPLLKPTASGTGRKRPLVLLVHGGPASNFSEGYGWETAWGEMLASHGYEVLMVNPRGSNGYSENFAKANRGDWGGGDYRDLMAVLDGVIAKGETDPDRLGIGGWSYGGEMSAWAITRSRRFKAAVAGAGVFDQQAEFETENAPADDEWYFGTPWEHPDVFARNSPASFIRNAHTPTLIFDGEEDQNNPVGQSKGLYRALKHFGVETQMVLYPGEGHSPKKGAYNIDMFTRILDWYDRHLKS
jgi:dipeptidyl aminopeptidase/acylaminoacyl peptidase